MVEKRAGVRAAPGSLGLPPLCLRRSWETGACPRWGGGESTPPDPVSHWLDSPLTLPFTTCPIALVWVRVARGAEHVNHRVTRRRARERPVLCASPSRHTEPGSGHCRRALSCAGGSSSDPALSETTSGHMPPLRALKGHSLGPGRVAVQVLPRGPFCGCDFHSASQETDVRVLPASRPWYILGGWGNPRVLCRCRPPGSSLGRGDCAGVLLAWRQPSAPQLCDSPAVSAPSGCPGHRHTWGGSHQQKSSP